jgi:hypothetical protein
MNTLLAELKALLEKHAPLERENYTRAQFCEAEGISLSTFHKLKRMGLAPEAKRFPGLALLRITHAARLAWRERMDQLALAEAQAHEAKQMLSLAKLFPGRTWRRWQSPEIAPHHFQVGINSTDKVALLPRQQSDRGDWSLGVNALRYLKAVVDDERAAAAYVVLVDRQGNIVAHADINKVLETIGDAEPIYGFEGAYHWVNAQFEPISNRRTGDDNGVL